MYYRWAVISLVLLSGCGSGVGQTGTSSAAPDPAATLLARAQTASPSDGRIRVAMYGGEIADPVYAASRCGVLVGDGSGCEPDAIRAFKEHNPRALTFHYEVVAAVRDADWASDDVNGYAWVSKHHPDWLLHDSDGNIIRFDGYHYIVAIDPGNPDYQKLWVETAIRNTKALGADGIVIDNFNSLYDWNFKTHPTKYPDRSSYSAAMDSFAHYVIPEIKRAGLLVIGNGSGEASNTAPWSEWITLLDGREYESAGNGKCETEAEWRDLQKSYATFPDKLYVHFLPHSTKDQFVRRFVFASFLVWQGPNSYLGVGSTLSDGTDALHNPLVEVNLGKPTSGCEECGDSAFRRQYERGLVVVNASGSKSQTVQIPSAMKDVSGESVAAGSRTLKPQEVLILTKS
jgi:hypothetical protein